MNINNNMIKIIFMNFFNKKILLNILILIFVIFMNRNYALFNIKDRFLTKQQNRWIYIINQ